MKYVKYIIILIGIFVYMQSNRYNYIRIDSYTIAKHDGILNKWSLDTLYVEKTYIPSNPQTFLENYFNALIEKNEKISKEQLLKYIRKEYPQYWSTEDSTLLNGILNKHPQFKKVINE